MLNCVLCLGIPIMFIEVLLSFDRPAVQSHGLQPWIITMVLFQKNQKVPKDSLDWTESSKEAMGKVVTCNLLFL